MSERVREAGSLSRANQLALGSSRSCSSVFTLHHWVEGDQANGQLQSVNRRRANANSAQKRRNTATHNRARLLLIKLQESAVNFLVRWFLLEESDRQDRVRAQSSVSIKARARHPSHSIASDIQSVASIASSCTHKQTRSSLLLKDVTRLPQRDWKVVLRYIFWRWFTWTNVFELILLLLLMGCCAYQCYELLDDYYKYPTHVTVSSMFNDDFRADLPALTLCDNNRISKDTLARLYPELNRSHYLAITLGTFHSKDNFSLVPPPNFVPKRYDWLAYGEEGVPSPVEAPPSPGTSNEGHVTEIDWVTVIKFLSGNKPSGHFNLVPSHDIIDTLTCANVWGDQIPCSKLRRVHTLQQAASCFTLFHDSVFWDKREEAVRQMEEAMQRKPSVMRYGDQVTSDEGQLLEFDPELELKEEEAENDLNEMQIDLANMEIIRMRVNFNRHDYAMTKASVGGRVAVHSNSMVDEVTHKAYDIRPGYWYSFYIDRFDYQRLPPPYTTNCFDYDRSRYVWSDRRAWLSSSRSKIKELVKRQASQPGKPIAKYVDVLRGRAMGKNECMKICKIELSTTFCGCWASGEIYGLNNTLDYERTIQWCGYEELLEKRAALNESTDGDDLFFQVCAKRYGDFCANACPDECYYSNFDTIQQSRSWPSIEAQRYIKDKKLWQRLRYEAECCATISIIYATPTSSFHMTEPKYTRQDMVTIISGNVEAWLGLSAVHAFLFFEHFYDALVEARLIRPLSAYLSTTFDGWRPSRERHGRRPRWWRPFSRS